MKDAPFHLIRDRVVVLRFHEDPLRYAGLTERGLFRERAGSDLSEI